MKKFVWDSSAILNIKEPNSEGYSPGHSLMKDLSDGWIGGQYFNIFPALAVFEINASVSRKHREGSRILREFYLLNEHSTIYPIDKAFVRKAAPLMDADGFNQLRGADLVFACIASIEGATLVTLDKGITKAVADKIDILDLNDSLDTARYRQRFGI